MKFTGRKGWKANYKDTFNLDMTLNPIILAGLLKFKEIMNDPEKSDQFNFQDGEYYKDENNPWKSIINKMIYAFSDNGPKLEDYNFKFIEGPDHGKKVKGGVKCNMIPDNKEEWERLQKDRKTHAKKVQHGLNLFAKYYRELWW